MPKLGFGFKLARAVEQPGDGLPRRHGENAGKDDRREQSEHDQRGKPQPQLPRRLLPRS
jgi:hypothetical protein